jgi:ectoine hydroxylase-related dioxygenase (phytanoyl-CoA dioxygenase family)
MAARSTVDPVILSDDEVARFFTEGFLVLSAVTSPQELRVIREIYDSLFEDHAGRPEGLYNDTPQEAELEGRFVYPKIHQIYRVAPELCATGFMANAWAISHQLLGSNIEFLGGHGFCKPAMSPAHTSWHQDQAYHRPDLLFRNVNVWLALQDTPVDSGAMEFVRASHVNDLVFEHRRPGGNSDAHGLELADSSVLTDVVSCPVSAGGATLHHSYTLHHTPPNQSAEPRRALIAIFGAPPKERAEPLSFSWQSAYARPGLGPKSRTSAN